MEFRGFFKISDHRDPIRVGSGKMQSLIITGGWQAKPNMPWCGMQAILIGFNRVEKYGKYLTKGKTIYLSGVIGRGNTSPKPMLYISLILDSPANIASGEKIIEKDETEHLPPKASKYKRGPAQPQP